LNRTQSTIPPRRNAMSEHQTTKDIQNGVTRPKPGTVSGRIWEITDSLSAQEGFPVARKKVLEAATAEGINAATAATQYGRWRKYHGLGAEPKSDVITEADVA